MMRSVMAALLLGTTATACASTTATTPSSTTAPPPATIRPPDPASVAANELGSVPILMYHRVENDPASEYDQTPAKFTAELDRLYREGYRPTTLAHYITGTMDLAAGTHPVVLTFDDSTTTQLALTATGDPAPGCAVALLEDFATQHPGFTATATFYVNNDPFADDPRALPWLARHGYEIGAHTATHANLSTLDAAGVQREFVQNLRAIKTAVPDAPVRSMALPLGVYPRDHALATGGSWDGTPYTFDSVLLVGANPASSPYTAVDPAAIPRIRSGRSPVQFDSTYWLDYLAAHPDERYTSDGDPTRISFPRALAPTLAPAKVPAAQPY